MAQRRKKGTLSGQYRGSNVYYNSGSVAYQTAVPAYIPEAPLPRVKARPLSEGQREERLLKRANRIYALKIFCAVAIIFCGCMAWIGMHAMLVKERIVLQEYKTQLAELKNENNMMMAELSEQMDLNKVKEIAESKLGMAAPQEYQVVYINVPKQSYTVQYATSQNVTAENTSFIQKILGHIKGMVRI